MHGVFRVPLMVVGAGECGVVSYGMGMRGLLRGRDLGLSRIGLMRLRRKRGFVLVSGRRGRGLVMLMFQVWPPLAVPPIHNTPYQNGATWRRMNEFRARRQTRMQLAYLLHNPACPGRVRLTQRRMPLLPAGHLNPPDVAPTFKAAD